MTSEISSKIRQRRYRYLAYSVIRDAIGFYLGIPKFLDNNNLEGVFDTLYKNKVKGLEKKKNRQLTTDELFKCRLSVDKYIVKRRQELIQDLKHCEHVLFTKNVWLELLDLNPEYLRKYLNHLPDDIKQQLSVVPRWTTRDHALSRPYINDDFQISNL